MIQDKQSSGFTIIELMLAMSFIAALLVVIALTTMQIIGTYTKGLTTREVNQAGRTVAEDIRRTVAASASFEISPVKIGDASDDTNSMYVRRPGGGRLCTGSYTYAWNYGNTQDLSGATATRVYNVFSDDSSGIIRFVKVSDTGGALCADPGRAIERGQAKELLPGGDGNIAMQSFMVSAGDSDDSSKQDLYAITFVLGTNNHSQLNPATNTCSPPSEGEGDENFCAINQFDIVVRTGNRSGSI